MTPELEALARHVVTLPGWRWMPGMLAWHINWRRVRISHVERSTIRGVCRYASPMGGVERTLVRLPVPTSDVLPDLTDSATLGCLLALVREAWGIPTLSPLMAIDSEWVIAGSEARLVGWGPTEAHALVAALEAAPRRGDS